MYKHGIISQYNIKHRQIVDFRTVFRIPPHYRDSFKTNYDFIWDIYNEVAQAHGLKIPKHFVCAEALTRRYRYGKKRANTRLLEPMGPVIPVDADYNIISYLYMNEPKGHAMYAYNWYEFAERFFMVKGSAHQVLTNPRLGRVREGLICKTWRAIDLHELG